MIGPRSRKKNDVIKGFLLHVQALPELYLKYKKNFRTVANRVEEANILKKNFFSKESESKNFAQFLLKVNSRVLLKRLLPTFFQPQLLSTGLMWTEQNRRPLICMHAKIMRPDKTMV